MSLKSVRTLTAAQLAKKWNISLAEVKRLIAQGTSVEKEHTKSDKEASEIARDHIAERPDYYKRLKKIEESGTAGVRGLGNVSGDPSGTNYVQMYIDSNSMSYNDENGNKFKWIKKHTKNHNKVGFDEYDPRKLKEGISAGPERETDYSIGDSTGNSRRVAKVEEKKILKRVSVKEQGSPTNPARYTERPLYETTVKKKVKYAVKAAGQQLRIAKELRPDEVESDKTYQKRKKGLNRVFKESQIDEFDTSALPMSSNIEDRRKGATPGGATPQNLEAPTTAKGIKDGSSASSTTTPSNTGGSGRSFPLDKQGKLDRVELRRQSDKDYESKTPSQMNEISAEVVGRISNARFWRGEAPSKTLSRAINKKFIESGQKKEDDTPFEGSKKRSHEKSSTHVRRLAVNAMKQYTKEETTMDTKELIDEALDNILENNLVDMKENFLAALQEKAMEKLEEKKKEIASGYFGQ